MSGSSWSSHSSQNQPSSTSSLTFPWSRGRPKTGWRRRIVIKEDLVAEDLQSAAGELLSRALLLVLLMKIVSWSLDRWQPSPEAPGAGQRWWECEDKYSHYRARDSKTKWRADFTWDELELEPESSSNTTSEILSKSKGSEQMDCKSVCFRVVFLRVLPGFHPTFKRFISKHFNFHYW